MVREDGTVSHSISVVIPARDEERTLPRLRLRGPEGGTSSSSITPGLFLRLLTRYLSANESNEALLWSPQGADIEYVSALPSD